MSEQPTTPVLAEVMTRLADGPRSKWHDEVLPNGAGESWVCVPIGDVLAALPPVLDVERLHTVTDSSGACTLPCPACQDIMRARHAEPDE